MPALRIDIRQMMIELVASLDGIGILNVSPHKLDKVEKANSASVYIQSVESDKAAMGPNKRRARELRIMVSLFLQDDSDAESKGATLLNDLESAVEATRAGSGFGGNVSAQLESATIDHDPNSKGKRADTHAIFLFEYTEALAS